MSSSVFERLQKILAEQFEIDEDDITLNSDIVDDLGADSLDLVDLVMSIEDEFEIEVPDEAIEEKMEVMLAHIGTLCEYKGTRVGMREARKHAAWYIKGIRGAASFRQEIGNLSSMDELRALAERVIDSQR